MKLVSTILSSVLGLQDTDPIAERVRLCQDMESAAGYIDAANPGLVKHRSFMDHFRGKLAGVHRRFFDELQGRPNIRAAFNAANTTYAAYVTDLGVDHTGENAGNDAPAPNYAPWWAVFRPAFTGVQSVYPWHILHGLTFRNPAKCMKAKETVEQYYDVNFRQLRVKLQMNTDFPHDDIPDWYYANVFFAGLDEHIRAALIAHPTYSQHCLPANIAAWDPTALYADATAVQNSPQYQAEAKARSQAKTNRSSMVSAIKDAVAAIGNVPDNTNRDRNRNRRDKDSKGKGGKRVDFKARAARQRALSADIKTEINDIMEDIRKLQPVAGSDGKLVKVKKGRHEGKFACCFDWELWLDNGKDRSKAGCCQPGHWNSMCPTHKAAPVSSPTSSTTGNATPAPAPANKSSDTSTNQQAKLDAIAKMLISLSGDDADVAAMYETTSPVISIAAAGASSTALIVTFDDGEQYLIDTGSRYTLFSYDHHSKFRSNGAASVLMPPTPGLRFVSATNTDMGYGNDAIITLPINGGQDTRACIVRDLHVPAIIGMDTLKRFNADISLVHDKVRFMLDNGSSAEYSFDSPTPSPIVIPAPTVAEQKAPSVTAPTRCASPRQQPRKSTAKWSSVLATIVVASAMSGAHIPDTPDEFEPHSAMMSLRAERIAAVGDAIAPHDPDVDVDHSPPLLSDWSPYRSQQARHRSDWTLNHTGVGVCSADVDDPWSDSFGGTANYTSATSSLSQSVDYGRYLSTDEVVDSTDTDDGGTLLTHSRYDGQGNLTALQITELDTAGHGLTTGLYGDRVGILHRHDELTFEAAAPVYREVRGDTIWSQMNLDGNAWANKPDNKAVLQSAFNDCADMFTPRPDGTLGTVHYPDGTPYKVKIRLKPDAYCRRRAHRVPAAYDKCIIKEVTEMRDLGVIRKAPEVTRFCSPLVCVPKPDKSIRVCGDYRGINEYIHDYVYPLVTAEDIFSRIGTATKFTTIDFSKWFWQFELHEDSRDLTTFATPSFGCWQYNRVPMGVKCAPAITQAFIDDVFRCTYDGPGEHHGEMALGNIICCYQDDMFICSNDDDHADVLAWCLRRLATCGVYARPDKCFIGLDKVHLLGHIISADGIATDPDKTSALAKMPYPTDVSAVRRFVNTAGYYRRYVPHFASRTAHLTDATGNGKFILTDKMKAEVDDIKAALLSPPVLVAPRFDLPFTIRSDGSERGVGWLLTQHIDGKRRIVACGSCKFNKHQQNYDVRKKEAWGVICATRKCKPYIQGSHFTLETDHRNLLWLKSVSEDTQQLYRWSVELSCLDFTTKHVAGNTLHDADMLSRDPIGEPVPDHDNSDLDPHNGGRRPYHTAAATTTGSTTKYNIVAVGHGLGADDMATHGTEFAVVDASDNDGDVALYYAKRSNATHRGSVADLLGALDDDNEPTPDCDVLSWTTSDPTATRIGPKSQRESADDPAGSAEMRRVIEHLRPRIVYIELPPPAPNITTHRDCESTLLDLGYDVISAALNCAHWDYTARALHVCVGSRTSTPVELPTPPAKFGGCQPIMLPPNDVPETMRSYSYTPLRRRQTVDAHKPSKLGTVSRGCCSPLLSGVFDPSHPMPPITPQWQWGGNKGSQWVMDENGARQWTVSEECDLHNYDEHAKAWLMNMSAERALGYIARGTPVGTLKAIYRQFATVLANDTTSTTSGTTNATKAPSTVLAIEDAVYVSPTTAKDKDEVMTTDDYKTVGHSIAYAMPHLGEIQAQQQAEDDIREVYDWLKADRDPKLRPRGKYSRESGAMHLHDGTVFYRTMLGDDEVLCHAILLPMALRSRVLQALHDAPHYGHPGLQSTLSIVKHHVYWKGMTKDIKKHIKECAVCFRRNTTVHHHAGKMVADYFYRPFQRFGMDCIGPFVACDGFKYVLHVICWACSFNVVACLPDNKAETVATALHRIFLVFGGGPEEMVSDNGKEFCNKVVDRLFHDHGIAKFKTSSLNPKGNSRTERRHRDYNSVLRVGAQEYRLSWPKMIHLINFAINCRPRPGTNHSPFELLFGWKPTTPAEATLKSNGKYEAPKIAKKANLSDEEYLKHVAMLREQAAHVVEQAWQKQLAHNRQYSTKVKYERKFNEGDLVLLSRPIMKKGQTTRLLYQNIGPFEVVEKLSGHTYRLRKLGSDRVFTQDIKYLNPYLTREAHERQIEERLDDKLDEATVADPGFAPKPGMFMLLTAFRTRKKPFFLVKITKVDDDESRTLHFHYHNNTTRMRKTKIAKGPKAAHLHGHLPVWKCEGKPEVQATRRPAGFVADVQYAPASCFAWADITFLQKTPDGISLDHREIQNKIKIKPPDPD